MSDNAHNGKTVKTNLKKGQVLESGFTVLDVVDLKELNSIGIWAKHDKCGVEIFHVLNDDSENLFLLLLQPLPRIIPALRIFWNT